jgi:CheY-like chemotaxis protein
MVKEEELPVQRNLDDVPIAQDEVSRLKLQFLASLNHELRTPLTGILGMTDLLLETELSAEQKDYVGATRSCAENLFEILNATLEFTALSAGNLMLEHTEFHLGDTLRHAAEEYRAQAEAKGLTLRFAIDPALPEFVLGDAVRVRQLLGYLLSNAVKFTHVGGVTVDAAAGAVRDDRVGLTVNVTDTGIGIQEQSLRNVFESFHQLERGLSRNYTGLGLGLALAQKLAAAMDGKIGAESTPGEGSRFWFDLPMRLAEVQVPIMPEKSTGGYRVLVVEDNPVAQEVVRHVLRRRSYTVDFVSSGEEAVEAAGTFRYNLILMDLQMPGMDGLEATRHIRGWSGYANVPIVAFTANASAEYRTICRDNGMQGFVTKPIDGREMLRTLDTLLP